MTLKLHGTYTDLKYSDLMQQITLLVLLWNLMAQVEKFFMEIAETIKEENLLKERWIIHLELEIMILVMVVLALMKQLLIIVILQQGQQKIALQMRQIIQLILVNLVSLQSLQLVRNVLKMQVFIVETMSLTGLLIHQTDVSLIITWVTVGMTVLMVAMKQQEQ